MHTIFFHLERFLKKSAGDLCSSIISASLFCIHFVGYKMMMMINWYLQIPHFYLVQQNNWNRWPIKRSFRLRSHRSIRYSLYAMRFALRHRRHSSNVAIKRSNLVCGGEQIVQRIHSKYRIAYTSMWSQPNEFESISFLKIEHVHLTHSNYCSWWLSLIINCHCLSHNSS